MPDSAQRPSFALLLQPEFPMNAFILASEALRIANQNSGRRLFDWSIVSESGKAVRASNGMWVEAEVPLGALPRVDFLMLFEGNLPTQRNSPQLLAALRAASRHGTTLIAVDTGAFAFAQAGLAAGRRALLHWEAVPAFRERFPEIEVEDRLYSTNAGTAYTAGGVATLDLMLDLIARHYGPPLANEVANALVYSPRPPETPQRIEDRAASAPTLARRIVMLMEQNLDFPLSPAALAAELGISVRSLERTCARHFRQSPMRLYLRVRLQAARNFLFYEELSMKEIADACGFSFPSVFTRAFRAQFGETPRQFREGFRARQAGAIRPEIARLAAAGE